MLRVLCSPFRSGLIAVLAAIGVLSVIGCAGETSIAIGQPAPDFRAVDQFGHEQTRQSLSGPNGLVLLFFRSADW